MQRYNLATQYSEKISPTLAKQFKYSSKMAVPKLEKVVVNVGLGRMSQLPHFGDKLLPEVTKELSIITGQKPAIRKAKKSIAGFKVREGATVGLQSTLRGSRMYDFVGRLINLVLPRTRDFRGVDTKSIDGRGNLTIGIREQYVFPEISPETSKVNFGMEITVVTTAKNKEEAMELYRAFGFPFKKEQMIKNKK